MKYRYISDSHCHSEHSFDGTDSINMLCDSAVHMGLHALTITDHCECSLYQQTNARESICRSVAETQKAAILFQERLQVLKGIELGQATQNLTAAKEILDLCDFDFVLGSLHNVKNQPDFYEIDYNVTDVHSLLETYFDEILELIGHGAFDSLAHLTYPLRYIVGDHNIEIGYEVYEERIDSVLRALIQKDKALEVNTSGLRQKIGEPLPSAVVIKRFHELGGKYVTIGSDAHRWADIGSGVEEGLDLIKRAGFDSFTVFINRKPKLLPLA
ncbi:MAG: histidinol-phosphatase HisJ family protein [Clostridiales bacterium]|jgi:histidinol-phosphatase (PHP family)|nr:histidinol-phosphatase HisJ family protein [Clostridiales bacterium]